ncbi:hypothetical protein MLD38_008671 [Melastoma candidum]|uniref:Uncharacterized protein n=1 Tax=Melastoma candidum TaxID=119954 RepID=A0ACB9RV18_9MYRT|nr:hypothetical protein MLD38_008671 [Melastoma candidum]
MLRRLLRQVRVFPTLQTARFFSIKALNPRPPKPIAFWVADSDYSPSAQMTSLDNHYAHDGYHVQSSCERECQDDDVMVEVLGSDVYVDGICGCGVSDDGEFDPNLWSQGALVEGLERRRQGLETRARDTTKDSSCQEGSETNRTDHTRKERSSEELISNPEELLEASSPWKRHKVDDPGITLGIEDVEIAIAMVEDVTTSSSGPKPSELGDVQFPEHSSSDDLLEQQFVADNPLVGHEEPIIHISEQSEIYQFEDANDSYWTDRVIATDPLDQPYYEYEGEMRNEDSRTLAKADRLLSTAKESSTFEGDCSLMGDNSPAELILIFPKTGSFPVAATLNKTLKMFGPLKESETQVDRKSNRARVVFRKFSDAKCHIALNFRSLWKMGGGLKAKAVF